MIVISIAGISSRFLYSGYNKLKFMLEDHGFGFLKNSVKKYSEAYQYYLNLPIDMWEKGEIYVASIYNYLIRNCEDIRYYKIERESVVFYGVPSGYDDFLKEVIYDLYL